MKNCKIPKRMNFFWVGKMSWMRWLTLHTFVSLNPDWEVYLYSSPDDVVRPKCWGGKVDDDNSYNGRDYRELISCSVIRSQSRILYNVPSAQLCDLFQWDILSKEGGFFSDMDILWINPMENIYDEVRNSDTMFCLESGVLAIGFMASAPKCVLFKDLCRYIHVEKNSDYQYYGTNLLYRFSGMKSVRFNDNPGLKFLEIVRHKYSKTQISDVVDSTVYPYDWRQIPKIFSRRLEVPKDSIGVHWFGGDPISNIWNNRLTPDNWRRHHNTFTECLRWLESKQVSVSLPTVNQLI